MTYYKLLDLHQEPFATSPNPSLLYLAEQYRIALYRLCISVKLKRGLNLIHGGVGVGKTTLSRQFAEFMSTDKRVLFYPVMNPSFSDELTFLKYLCYRFGCINESTENQSLMDYYSSIDNFLYRKAHVEKKSIVLMIDESQKLSKVCLEVLRSLLNFETNQEKLIQIVLFAQNEITQYSHACKSFWDRIAFQQELVLLSPEEMENMIHERLVKSGYKAPIRLFSNEAIALIYEMTQGQPRQVIRICHDALEFLVMHDLNYVDQDVISKVASASRGMQLDGLNRRVDAHAARSGIRGSYARGEAI